MSVTGDKLQSYLESMAQTTLEDFMGDDWYDYGVEYRVIPAVMGSHNKLDVVGVEITVGVGGPSLWYRVTQHEVYCEGRWGAAERSIQSEAIGYGQAVELLEYYEDRLHGMIG